MPYKFWNQRISEKLKLPKLFWVLSFATFAALPANAKDYDQARSEAYQDAMVISVIGKKLSPCAVIGSQVSEVMVKRLQGVAMSEQMAEPNFEFFHFVIRDAYTQPFFETSEMKERLVRDFREKYEVECFDVLGSEG